MRLLLDTNVVLDILLERRGFCDDALDMMEKAISKGDRLFLSSSAATDIYYIVRKNTQIAPVITSKHCRIELR